MVHPPCDPPPVIHLNMFIWKTGAGSIVNNNKSGSQLQKLL